MKYLKKTILLLAVSVSFMTCSCGNDMEKVEDSPRGQQTQNQGKQDPTVDWAALADSCIFVLTDNFMVKSEGTFRATPGDQNHDSDNLYWQQAPSMWVLLNSYERIKDSNSELAATYRQYAERWYENDAHNYNNSREGDGKHGHFFNDWVDDMNWMCLTLVYMSRRFGDDTYAVTARGVYDNYIIPQKRQNGGLPWTDIAQPGMQDENACTNVSGLLVALELYSYFKDGKYLSDARELMTFCREKLLFSDYRVEEPPLSYTQGIFAEACRQMFHITGDKTYMELAGNVLNYAFTSNRCTSAGLLRSEGDSNDQSIFKCLLIPCAVEYVMDASCTHLSSNIEELLINNAKALNSHLDRSCYPRMFAGFYWGETFTGAVASMGAQASGAALIEGVARMTSKH